MSVYKQIVTSN